MKNYKLMWGGKDNTLIPLAFKPESIMEESTVVSGSSLEGSSSIVTHEDMNVGDKVLAASIEGLPDTDVASEFLLWEYTGSDPISSQITLVTASIESITTSSHADFKLIETSGESEPLKISDNALGCPLPLLKTIIPRLIIFNCLCFFWCNVFCPIDTS